MAKLPESFHRFTRENPAVAKAYEALGEACAQAGPLDPRTRELVKLGMAIGARLEGAVPELGPAAGEAGGGRTSAPPAEGAPEVALIVPMRPRSALCRQGF